MEIEGCFDRFGIGVDAGAPALATLGRATFDRVAELVEEIKENSL